LRRRRLLAALGATSIAVPLACLAQRAATMPRIGVMGTVSTKSPVGHLFVEFRRGLYDRGYEEGKNIAIEWRDERGDPKLIQEFAAEFVRLEVDVIVAPSSTMARMTRSATRTIPIVTLSGDPIADGTIRRLANVGGNVTGLSTQSSDVIGKQLELLKQIVPQYSRVAILANPGNAFHEAQIEQARSALKRIGATLQVFTARNSEQLAPAFEGMAKAQMDAVLVLVDGTVFLRQRVKIAQVAGRLRLPTMYPRKEHVEAGGLVAYGADRRDLFRRLAFYVDKILKGARPADLPVEQPTKFELVVNLRTAKALGVEIPPSILLRADQVIE